MKVRLCVRYFKSTGRIRWYEYGGYIAVLRAGLPGGNGFALRGWGSLFVTFVQGFWLFPMGWIQWAEPFLSCRPRPRPMGETYCVTLLSHYQQVTRLTSSNNCVLKDTKRRGLTPRPSFATLNISINCSPNCSAFINYFTAN